MWSVEHSAETDLPASAIWQAWAAVERWAEWNPDIAEVSLQGPFASGSRVTMTPMGQEPVELRILDANPLEQFVDEADLDGTIIRTMHRIDDIGSGRLRVVYALEVHGPMEADLGPAISADFEETIAGLLRHAAAETGDGDGD